MNAEKADVVIIGSGAGGGASAWALSQAGVKVMVIEAGPAYDPFSDYNLHKPSWEKSEFPYREKHKARYSYGDMQPLESRWDSIQSWNHVWGKTNRTKKRYPWKYHHARGVGGSTLHFTGEAHRLNPESMQMFSRFGVAADWPVDYQELEPYYVKAECVIGVAGPENNKTRPRSGPYPLPAHKFSYASQKVIEATRGLGLNWEANSLAVLSRPFDNRPACNYCANCNRGCPRTDKGSVDVTFMRKALATGNCILKSDSPVIRINAGENDSVKSVEYIDSQGNKQKVDTRVLVVACGAIETPRMLLLSSNKHAPNGLANETGHVGKHFMETLSWVSNGLHPERLDTYRGLPSDMICWDYNAPDAIEGLSGGVRFSPVTAETGLVGPIGYANRAVKGWGHSHKRAMRETFGRVLSIGAIGESLPNNKSFISIDRDKKDTLGLPVARIHSFLDEMEIRRVSFMADKSREIIKAAGCEEIFEEFGNYDIFSSTHVFGTCRMGNDPQESVVDKNCRSHRWKNLYVVDASVFPSSGGGESPSLTIEALAIRTAEKIREAMLVRES